MKIVRTESGFTLLEGMIATVILSVGVIAMGAMQGIAITRNVDSTESRIGGRGHFLAQRELRTRLVRAARMFENTGFSIARVATHLEYSSPQSFGRHVRALLQLTAGEFRRRYDGEGMLHRFREELVLQHISVLRTFRPLAAMPGWISSPSAAPRSYRRAARPSAAPV